MESEANEVGVVQMSDIHEESDNRKAKTKRQELSVKDIFHDYASNTTLHGLPYTTRKDLTMKENIGLCSFLINNVWVKWQTSPVIVTFSEELVSVSQVPFPSILICPQLKIKASVYNYTREVLKFQDIVDKNDDKYFKGQEDDYAKLNDVSQVCNWRINDYYRIFPQNYSDARVVRNIMEVAPKKRDVFVYCNWRGYEFDVACEYSVSEILTNEGLCYIVNSLSADDILRRENIHNDYPYLTAKTPSRNWTLEDGYTDFGFEVYPVSGKENGVKPDLEVIMVDKLNEHDDMCNVLNTGFKVYVQHPADFPLSSLYHYPVLNHQVTSMALSFSSIHTSESLRKYPPKVRQCYFPGERYLQYFKIYTANNCRLECISNYTYALCGCVGYYMLRETSKQICTHEKSECMFIAQEMLTYRVNKKKDEECACLPACDSIDYEAEVIKTDYRFSEQLTSSSRINKIPPNVDGQRFSKLEVYFKRPRFVSMRRSELFGLTDFFANIGGLLGLFLGFSFLSLVEIFYFLTLRLYSKLMNDSNIKDEKVHEEMGT